MAEYLQKQELERFLQSIPNERDRLLAQFLYESGCAISEVCELKTSAVHADGTVQFDDRKANISAELAKKLLAGAGTHIFSTRQAATITAKRVQQILKPYLALVHKGKITPQLLRYTHIIHAHNQGIPLHAISEQTGLTAVRLAQILADVPAQKGYGQFFDPGKGGKI